ncbi:DUF4149 domain-containing protein [Methylotenera sp. G11]|uniref:DUF4149 domain-containing protein n=1 Tax=Methylotenera sp. G11 TaxID=1506585 RepID=UPI00064657E0|nr:DUF4149 domain-containing protein [Methylotenera sp. G11]
MAYRLSLIMVTLWAGALWSAGISAYVLFDSLQDKQLAGMLAGKLFTVVTYIGMVSAFYLLIHRLVQDGTAALKQAFFWAVFVMLLLVLAGHFGIQPILENLKAQALPADVMQSVFADRFRSWHGIASVAYLVECLLAFVVVLKSR